MNDVFDEDLMKELGLNADDIATTPKPGNAAPRRAPMPPAPGAAPNAQPPGSAPKQPPRPLPRAPVGATASGMAGQSPQERPAPRPPAEPRAEAHASEIDVEAHARRMTEDLPVQMAAVLAKKSIALKDVIDMRVGEVIDFKKAPQDPIDLVANGKLIAKAEMVLVDGKLGVKIVKLVK